MTEEYVTKKILYFLELNSWIILCFDFPQSGTGVSLHINSHLRSGKNKGLIIPDIIAYKDRRIVFFENKDKYVFSDFVKLGLIKTTGNYSESLTKFLDGVEYDKIYYGVGIPLSNRDVEKTLNNVDKIDFALFVKSDGLISVEYEAEPIFY